MRADPRVRSILSVGDSGIFACLPADEDSMLTDWLKIMLDEIARKQAELDSGRAEQQRREQERATAEPHQEAKRRASKGAKARRP